MDFVSKTASRVVLGVCAAGLFVAAISAQAPNFSPSPGVAPSEANHFIETPKGWVHPRTAWGDPDLTGIWPIAHGLNLVRTCPRGGGPGRGGPAGAAPATAPAAPPCDPNNPPLFKTAEAYQAEVDRALGVRKTGDAAAQALAAGNIGAALQSGASDPTFPERQTSMIVDPPNGKLPELTAEGKRRSALMKSSWAATGETADIPPPGSNLKLQTWDAPEDFDSWDRCITRGMPTSMMPYRYNNGINIIQAPGMVVLSLEMIHEDRIVYTDGRAPLKAVHKHYMGEPRGRWEGTHARHHDDELQGRTVGHQYRRLWFAERQSLAGQRSDEDHRAADAIERQHDALRDEDRGSGDHGAAVHRPLSVAARTTATNGGNTTATRAIARFATTSTRRASSEVFRLAIPTLFRHDRCA